MPQLPTGWSHWRWCGADGAPACGKRLWWWWSGRGEGREGPRLFFARITGMRNIVCIYGCVWWLRVATTRSSLPAPLARSCPATLRPLRGRGWTRRKIPQLEGRTPWPGEDLHTRVVVCSESHLRTHLGKERTLGGQGRKPWPNPSGILQWRCILDTGSAGGESPDSKSGQLSRLRVLCFAFCLQRSSLHPLLA